MSICSLRFKGLEQLYANRCDNYVVGKPQRTKIELRVHNFLQQQECTDLLV